MVTEATLVEIIYDNKLLLKKSTRGVSKGKWNGLGGKIENGETPEQSAIRETLEESALVVDNLLYHGKLNFHNNGKDDVDLIVHLFSTKEFGGRPKLIGDDGGELQWFPLDDLPIKDMWKDDIIWMPLLLEEKHFDADFYFDEKNEKILRHEIKMNEMFLNS